MSNGNFVPYSRASIPDTTWFTNKNKTLSFLMFVLLLDAHYKKGAWYGIPINRGEVVFGCQRYAERLGMNEKTLIYSLKQLEKLGEIKVETKTGFNGYTKVSILKYDNYVPKLEYGEKPKKQEDEGDGVDHYFDDAIQY